MKISSCLIIFLILYTLVFSQNERDSDTIKKEIFKTSEIGFRFCTQKLRRNRPIEHMFTCTANVASKSLTFLDNKGISYKRYIRKFDLWKYEKLWEYLLSIDIWKLDSVSTEMVIRDKEKFLDSNADMMILFGDLEFHFRINKKAHTYTVSRDYISNLKNKKYQRIFEMLVLFFLYEEITDNWFNQKNDQKSLKYNKKEIMEDSEIGYIEQFDGVGHIGPVCTKYLLTCQSTKAEKIKGHFYSDGTYDQKKSIPISLKRYLYLFKEIFKHNIRKLKTTTLLTLENIKNFYDIYTDMPPIGAQFYHIIFIRIKQKYYAFRIQGLTLLKDKSYLNIIKEIIEIFGKRKVQHLGWEKL